MTDRDPIAQALEDLRKKEEAEKAERAATLVRLGGMGLEVVRDDFDALEAIRLGLEEDDKRTIAFDDADFTVGIWDSARTTLLESGLTIGISSEGRVIGIRLANWGLKRFIWPLPSTLLELDLSENPIVLFSSPLPDTLRTLDVRENELKDFAIPLPPSLEKLCVDHSNLVAFSSRIPDSLTELRIGFSPLHRNEAFVSYIASLGFAETDQPGIRGVFIRKLKP